MKKFTKTLLVCGVLALGLGINTNAMAENDKAGLNVAVVNIPAVVASSSDVMALKKRTTIKDRRIAKMVNNSKIRYCKTTNKRG